MLTLLTVFQNNIARSIDHELRGIEVNSVRIDRQVIVGDHHASSDHLEIASDFSNIRGISRHSFYLRLFIVSNRESQSRVRRSGNGKRVVLWFGGKVILICAIRHERLAAHTYQRKHVYLSHLTCCHAERRASEFVEVSL